jgi:multiple sugar transport system permease protein
VNPGRRYLVLVHVAALGAAAVILAPFAWLVLSSLATPAELLARPLRWIPADPSLDRYRQIFTAGGTDAAGAFRAALLNSTIVAACTVAVSMAVGIVGAYAFARLDFRGRRLTLRLFLATYMLPPIAIVIPIYLLMARAGLLDTKLGLVVVYCSFVTPFVLWIMSNYFLALPPELEDAARVDGCSRLGALFRVTLPVARPGVFATTMFGFLLAWDEFLYALILTSTGRAKTVPVAIAEFTGRHSVDFGLVAAGGVLASVPPVLLAVAFQKYVVSGLTSGALKG